MADRSITNDMPEFGDEYVEAVYTVTITNTGDERALGESDVHRLLEEFARQTMPDEFVHVHVESH